MEIEYEEGSPCPVCGSDRISQLSTKQIVIERNFKTGKLIKRDKNYENGASIFWNYKCRKCGWVSDVFTE